MFVLLQDEVVAPLHEAGVQDAHRVALFPDVDGLKDPGMSKLR